MTLSRGKVGFDATNISYCDIFWQIYGEEMARSDAVPAKNRQRPSQADYETLSEFRYLIRRFLAFSEVAARDAGLAPSQHQALLAIKGVPAGQPMTIGDLAERLCIRHNSAVELVDRLGTAGLVVRTPDESDHRRMILSLTEAAEDHLAHLSVSHLDELARLEPALKRILVRARS